MSSDPLLAEFDALMEVQGRLLFAGPNHDPEEAERYGVRLLDWMRLHGPEIRSRLAALQDTP